MNRTNVYPIGTILLFDAGEYSDRHMAGEVVTLAELDLPAEIEAWRTSLGVDEEGDPVADDYGHGPDIFVAHLIANQIVAPLKCQSVHIGSYGRVEL